MGNMENVDLCEDEDHNKVNVVIEKGEYELAKDTHVISITYLKKPFKKTSRQLYVILNPNTTS
jgi:hypothetical protein